jgi:F-type H+-transporting ATPase subunit b
MLSRKSWVSLSLAANAAFAAVALGAEHEGAAEAEPSLFGGDLGNAIWTLVIFFLLLVVLGKFAWKPLLSALQNREKFIRDSLETARRDRESAEARLHEYEQRLAKAQGEATALIEEARREAEAAKRRFEEEARKSGERMVEKAKRDIGSARDEAIKDLYAQSADLAVNVARNVIKRELTPEDQQRLIREAMSELRKKPASEN